MTIGRLAVVMAWSGFFACPAPGGAAAAETLVKSVAEFAAAVKIARPGDTIVLADGEWRDVELDFSAAGRASIENPRSIDDGVPVTLRAETPGKVVLTGSSRLLIGGPFLRATGLLWKDSAAVDAVVAFRKNSRTLARCSELAECAIAGDTAGASERKWVSLYGAGNRVARCRFEGKQSGGTLLVVWLPEKPAAGTESAEPVGHRITGNFFGPRSRLGKNGGEIIRIGDSKTSLQPAGVTVDKNYFYRTSGEAEIVSNKSCDNEYRHNVLVGCGGALTLRHGNHATVSGNAFFGDGLAGTGGVRVIGEGHLVSDNLFHGLEGTDGRAAVSLMNGLPDSPLNGYFQVKQADIAGNDFFGCRQCFLIGSSDKDRKNQTLPPVDCTLSGNTVVRPTGPVLTIRTAPTGLKSIGNRYGGGELGVDAEEGWKRLEAPADFDPKTFPLPVRPGEVGPPWLSVGDEVLPEILKAK